MRLDDGCAVAPRRCSFTRAKNRAAASRALQDRRLTAWLLFRRRDSAGVIVDDAPAFREALPNQREDAADVAFVLVAGQVPVTQNQRPVVAGEMKLEVGEIELAHRRLVGVDLLVSCANSFESTLDAAGAGESEVWRVPVGGHESVDIALVPRNLLNRKELSDRNSVFRVGIGGHLGSPPRRCYS